MNISYSSIFKDAWKIAVRNKILWLLGIFASFLSLEAVYEVILSQFNQATNLAALQQKIFLLYQNQIVGWQKFWQLLDLMSRDYQAQLIFIIFAVAVIILFWLVFSAQILIVKIVAKLRQGQVATLSAHLWDSNRKFFPVFFLNVLSKLAIYGGLVAFSLPLFYAFLVNSSQLILPANIFFLVTFIVFAVIISFLTAYATNYIVLKDLNVFEAIRAAWLLFSRNIAISLEVAFFLFFFKLVSLLIIIIVCLLISVPLLGLLFYATFVNSILLFVLAATLIILIFVICYFGVSAVFTAFYLSSWTITFINLNEDNLFSKLIYLWKNIKQAVQKMANKYNIQINKGEVKKEAKKIALKLEEQYKVMAPVIKKNSKIVGKKIVKGYQKVEPILEAEIKKIIEQRKKRVKANPAKKKSSKSKIINK